MDNKQNSNVIHIDFRDRKAHKVSDGTQVFYQRISGSITSSENTTEEWPEDITPKERSEQLKQDLEFLQQKYDIPPATQY
ncbi:MAG: hypothetical protein ACI910_002809 [Oleispira sp.]|jgi:hypothetical protein